MKDQPNHRILVIDDNSAIHDDFRKILVKSPGASSLDDAEASLFGESTTPTTQISFELDSAHQGKDALELVKKSLAEGRPYAMAFVDVRMPPGWDGIETISHIWAIYPELQIVLCTAYSDYSWEQVAKTLGNTENILILKKPFDNIEVQQLAHALTSKWLLNRQAKCQMEDLEVMVQERTRALRQTNEQLQQEITERALAEAALRLSEERFAKAFQASPIPMAMLAVKTEQYVDVNDSFLEMTGYAREEVIYRTSGELRLWAENSICTNLGALLGSDRPLRNLESQIRTKDGKLCDTLTSIEVFSLGVEPYMLMITQDISDLLSLENQLRQSQKMEAVGQLAAGIAHDFNNLLTVIQGHASLRLADPNLDSTVAESLQHVQGAADRASTLTRQLLAFSRKQVMQPKPLDLNNLVDQMAQLLVRVIGEHISLQRETLAGLPSVYGDTGNIEQVIMNLAVNARDAMPKGGTLTIRTSIVQTDAEYSSRNPEAAIGSFICLTVADTGCGMDEETRGRIFEPFFTTKDVGKGTGMGLATVYGIVKQHRGWVEVETEVGRGTTFRVFLPTTDAVVEVAREKPVTTTKRGGRETILMVEDEPLLRELVQTLLEIQGYRILSAESGAEALRIWNEHQGKIDLLLTDMVMPGGMTGRELAAQLKPRDPKLKVIFTSGYSQEMVGCRSSLQEGVNFLPKPYRPPALAEIVRTCLDSAQSATAFITKPANPNN